MFKILILQRLYNLSDAGIEYQLLDRLSFMRFLGIELKDAVPDEKTIWLFREKLTQANVIEKIFTRFNSFLEKKGLIAQKGNIVDATFIEVPKQRNNREENKRIKNGQIPDDWKLTPNKLKQKDVDARWMTKDKVMHYGYKDHIKIDRKSKIIRKYKVTDASVHDSLVYTIHRFCVI